MVADDITLPLLNLFSALDDTDRKEMKRILALEINEDAVNKIRKMLINSNALNLTQKTALYYVEQAKQRLNELESSDYRRSLNNLTDFIGQKTF